MKHRIAIGLGAGAAAVAVLGLVLILTRSPGSPGAGPGEVIPAEAWTGIDWIEISSDARDGPGWASIYDARRIHDELVAWGFTRVQTPEGEQERPAIWRSTDAFEWRQMEVTIDGHSGFVPTAAASGPLGIIAAGYSDEQKGNILAGSTDGANWTALAHPALGVDMHLIAGIADGYVAGGYADIRATTWVSGDGLSWTELPVPDARDGLQLHDLVTASQGTFLSGVTILPGEMHPALWRLERDVWTPLPLPLGAETDPIWAATVDDLVPFHGGVFAIGRAGPVEPCPIDPAEVASAAVDLASTSEDGKEPCPWPPPAAWVSVDGVSWREAALPVIEGVDPDQAVYSVASGGAGLIALVSEDMEAIAPRLGIWTSPDGSAWIRIGDAMPMRRGLYYSRFVAMPGRVVVFGNDDTGSPLAWVGIARD
jgi:hypothetical protein